MTAPAQHWTATPERSNMTMLRIMTWISLHLGRRASRLILHGIAGYFLLFSPRSRNASRAYLQRALDRRPQWADLYRHFFSFASTIHDRIYLVNRQFDLFDFELHGTELLLDLHAEGRGLFLLGAHLGSFEVLRSLGLAHPDIQVAMVMHEAHAQRVNAILAVINPTAMQDIIGLGKIESMLSVRERLDAGYLVGMLADRAPTDDSMRPVQFLGKTAYMPEGPLRMAALLRRPVLFMTGLYLGGNRYRIHFDALADFTDTPRSERSAAVAQAMTDYAALLERYCRATPYNWFNFFDFWQHPAGTRPP
ncbi:MAG: LpxL/LpxP family acyltransferase [Burkholderiales bacterium]